MSLLCRHTGELHSFHGSLKDFSALIGHHSNIVIYQHIRHNQNWGRKTKQYLKKEKAPEMWKEKLLLHAKLDRH